MLFVGTRGNGKEVTFSQAILNPAASFGGLYAPKTLPYLNLKELKDDDYKTVASKVLKLFDLDLKEELIEQALERYNSFDTPQIVPIVEVDNNLYISELYHGPTRAFKDMALQPFGYILSKLAQERGENYLILAATSGDTGPATLETFKNQPNIKVVCLYPAGGTSDVQRLQMVTEDGENLKVIGIRGNFDDAQTALKALLSSEKFNQTLQEKGIKLSAANSVNFGRIIFQIIYHIYSYLKVA
ncbi:MAG: threonine synthase, partial [Epsilonproteobacteria bacterium]|nr:threonine synthase [Campylobacterota bacterium]